MPVQIKIAVSTVIEKDGKFLMVEEPTNDGIRINQPSGRLIFGETPQDGAIREVLDVSKQRVILTGFISAYQLMRESNGAAFIQLCFCGKVGSVVPEVVKDKNDIHCVWLTHDEIIFRKREHRNPMVEQCILDYKAHVLPISAVKAFFI